MSAKPCQANTHRSSTRELIPIHPLVIVIQSYQVLHTELSYSMRNSRWYVWLESACHVAFRKIIMLVWNITLSSDEKCWLKKVLSVQYIWNALHMYKQCQLETLSQSDTVYVGRLNEKGSFFEENRGFLLIGNFFAYSTNLWKQIQHRKSGFSGRY